MALLSHFLYSSYLRPTGVLPVTPYADDFAPAAAVKNPSAASPRLSSSRTAAALLGHALLKAEIVYRIQLLRIEHDLQD